MMMVHSGLDLAGLLPLILVASQEFCGLGHHQGGPL